MNFVTLCMLVITFFLFSFLGWLMEVILKFIQYHRFINRGFLIGPYCPIYGFGVVAIIVLVGGYIGWYGGISDTFLAGAVICGILEYFVGWYMEKMFHARWWDYSNKPMNLHGRIWIGNMALFGVASVFVLKFISPRLLNVLSAWPENLIIALAFIIVILVSTDCIVSHILMNIVKGEIDKNDQDNTEEINKKVRELLKNRGLLIRRINAAYPHLQARPKSLKRLIEEERNKNKSKP